MRLRGVSVLHCHCVLVWRRAVFSIGFSTTGKGWEKATFYWVSEGTLETFLVRFRGVSVLHCHGVLVWPRAVFSTGGSTTGKGWQNWQKAIFNKVSKGTLETFFGAISWRVRPSLPWCFGVAEGCFQHRIQYNGKRLGKGYFLLGFRRDVRNFFGAISWRVRPSLPWCFGVAEGWQNWQKAIFNSVSEGTLKSFLVRFPGVSVLHCHGVLVWRRAVFSTGFSTTGKGWEKATFYRINHNLYYPFTPSTIHPLPLQPKNLSAIFTPCLQSKSQLIQRLGEAFQLMALHKLG